MKTKSLLLYLSKKFPKRIAKKYNDYHGLMVGQLKEKTNTIVLCLDLDYTIYEKIKELKPDLVITHHPFIYGKKSFILKNDKLKSDLYNKILKDKIPVYSFHTSFDEGKYGMNDALAEKLELLDIKPLKNDPMARGGYLKETLYIDDFIQYVLNKFNLPYLQAIKEGKKEIKTVAIIGGGGWHGFYNAKEEGYDVFISGDMPHHAQRDVLLLKYNYLNISHEVENIFMDQMEKNLLKIDNSFKIYKIFHEIPPKIYLKK